MTLSRQYRVYLSALSVVLLVVGFWTAEKTSHLGGESLQPGVDIRRVIVVDIARLSVEDLHSSVPVAKQPSRIPSMPSVDTQVLDSKRLDRTNSANVVGTSESPSSAPHPVSHPSASAVPFVASQLLSHGTTCRTPVLPVSSLSGVQHEPIMKPASQIASSVYMCSSVSDADGVLSLFLASSDIQSSAHCDVSVTVVFPSSSTMQTHLAQLRAGTWQHFRMYLQFFVNRTQVDAPCLEFSSPNCSWRNRELVAFLGTSPAPSQSSLDLVSRFVPDQVSGHYRFVIEWKSQYVVSDVVSPRPFEVFQSQFGLVHSNNGYVFLPCHPFLHLNVPYMHDFVVVQFTDSLDGVDTQHRILAPANTTITASFGVNRFLVTYPPQLAALYPDHVRHTSFFGRLINNNTIVNINASLLHDEKLQGYVVEFDLRDPGEYALQLGIDWYFGDSEPGERPPISVGSKMGLQWEYLLSDLRRSFVHWGRPLTVVLDSVPSTAPLPRFGRSRCTFGDAPGRWVNLGGKPCSPPYCTGDRQATVNLVDWNARAYKGWVWVPYTCYFHLYTKDDLLSCAMKEQYGHIHVMGDSQQREIVSIFKQVNGSTISVTKYDTADFEMTNDQHTLRISFMGYPATLYGDYQFATTLNRSFVFDQPYFDHFNIRPANNSGQPLVKSGLLETENSRPDVFIMNNGNGGSTKYMNTSRLQTWLTDLMAYLGNGRVLWQPPIVAGRPGLRKPIRKFLWLSSETVSGPGRAGNVYVSSHRVAAFSKLSADMMRSAGFPVVDAMEITKARWEASWDGVHFAGRLQGDNWGSQVASMVYQVVLNSIFEECTER